MRTGLLWLAVAAVCLGATSESRAQRLVGFDVNHAEFVVVDANTGAELAASGPTGFTGVTAFARRPSDGMLLLAASGVLHQVSPAGFTSAGSVAITGPASDVQALEFDGNGGLWAVAKTASGQYHLAHIDPGTGVLTLGASAGIATLHSLAYDESTARFYSWRDGPPWSGTGLVYFHAAGVSYASSSCVFQLSNLVTGLAFDANGGLWKVDSSAVVAKVSPVSGCELGSSPLPAGRSLRGLSRIPVGGGSPVVGWTGTCPGTIEIHVSGATPDGLVAIGWAAGNWGSGVTGGPCVGTLLGIASQGQQYAIRRANSLGMCGLGPTGTVPSQCGSTWLQALDLATCATSNVAPL